MSEYTPTTDEVRETYERARYYLDDMPEEGDSYRAGGGEFDRWITAHDRALREQIAQIIYDTLNGQYGDFCIPDDADDAIGPES